MQMNERGTRDGGGCGCQKSRLDLWLIERDTFLGWSELEKLDVRFDGTNIGGFTVIPAPRAIGYNPIVPLVFPTRCSASSSPTSNLFHEYHASARVRTILTRLALTPRSRADFSAKIQYPGIPPPIFSSHLLPKTKEKLFNRPLRMHFHPNSNNIEDVARSPIRSTMSPRESKEIATHRDYCTTKLRVTVLSTPPRLYALKSSILDYRSYLENKIKVVIRRGKKKSNCKPTA